MTNNDISKDEIRQQEEEDENVSKSQEEVGTKSQDGEQNYQEKKREEQQLAVMDVVNVNVNNNSDKSSRSSFPPKSEWTLISQGAEARVWKIRLDSQQQQQQEHQHQKYVVCKERFSKSYRHPDLDARLTKSRCRSEAKILEKCSAGKGGKGNANAAANNNNNNNNNKSRKKAKTTTGTTAESTTTTTTKSQSSTTTEQEQELQQQKIRVPRVVRVSPPSLFLEYIDGPSVKEFLQKKKNSRIQQQQQQEQQQHDDRSGSNKNIPLEELAKKIGQVVGRIHNLGIIHGDLTTSNIMMIFDNDDDCNIKTNGSYELCPIDFGLAKLTSSIEEQAVDLYVLERALESTHPDLPGTFFSQVLKSYDQQTTTTTTTTPTDTDNVMPTTASTKKNTRGTQSTLDRLEQVRMRGRKRECFG
mmetsp:Transcript_23505/g.55704  ORF Transcript_23505/g.55704 Transcript_23505/m.55704 type:complete len:415 (-) Transcript_23505:123-1367(-)